jgi:hypothetical protein
MTQSGNFWIHLRRFPNNYRERSNQSFFRLSPLCICWRSYRTYKDFNIGSEQDTQILSILSCFPKSPWDSWNLQSAGSHIVTRNPKAYGKHWPVLRKLNVKLSLCLMKHNAVKTYGEWTSILNVGSRWRWVVIFTVRPVYPRGKCPRYPLDRRLGRPHSQSGSGGEEKNPFSALSVYRTSVV